VIYLSAWPLAQGRRSACELSCAHTVSPPVGTSLALLEGQNKQLIFHLDLSCLASPALSSPCLAFSSCRYLSDFFGNGFYLLTSRQTKCENDRANGRNENMQKEEAGCKGRGLTVRFSAQDSFLRLPGWLSSCQFSLHARMPDKESLPHKAGY